MKIASLIQPLIVASLMATPLSTLSLHAQQIGVTWNPGTAEPTLWSDPANWGGTVPVSGYKAFFNVAGVGPCVVDGVAGGCQIAIGDSGGPATLIVTNGGFLTAGDSAGDIHNIGWSQIGGNGTGTLIIGAGGTVNFILHMWIGQGAGGNGTLIMNGGVASVANNMDANWQCGGGGTGHIYMNGGTLYLGKWDSGRFGANSSMDLAGGTVVVTGDRRGNINTDIANGKVTAYGGSGTVTVDYNNLNPGMTTITASSGNTPPSQSITSIIPGEGNVTITYTTTPGFTYHIDSSPSLSPAAWSPVAGSTITAGGTSETYTIPQSGPQQFYRTASP